MKKIKKLFALLVLTLIALSLVACSNDKQSSKEPNTQMGVSGITHFTQQNSTVFYLNNYSGNAIFELERSLSGAGAIYYSVQLEVGGVKAVYDEQGGEGELFSVSDLQKHSSSCGSVSGSKVEVTFTSLTPSVSGKIVIAFVPFGVACENGHFWGGSEIRETIGGSYYKERVYTCRICDQTIGFGISDSNPPDDKRYSFSVLYGAEKLYEMPYEYYYSGEMVEVKVKKSDSANLLVTVNGTPCLSFTEYKDFNCYSFLMPNENVQLKVLLQETAQ